MGLLLLTNLTQRTYNDSGTGITLEMSVTSETLRPHTGERGPSGAIGVGQETVGETRIL